MFSIKNQRLD